MNTARRRLLALALCSGSLVAATVPAVARPLPSDSPTPCVESALTERCPTWVSTYDNPNGHAGGDSGGEVVVAPDGSRAFMTGISYDKDTGTDIGGHTPGGLDIATVAFDPATGLQLWATRFNGTDDSGDQANKIEVSPDGSKVFVFGVTDYKLLEGEIVARYVTIAYDAATGHELWVSRETHDSPQESSWATDLAIDPTGEFVYVTGYAMTVSGPGPGQRSSQITTIAYDADSGEQVWANRDITGSAFSIQASPRGDKVFVTGTLGGGIGPTGYGTIAYEARDPARLGEVLWIATYDGGNQGGNQAYHLAVSPDGSSVYVTGRHNIRFESQQVGPTTVLKQRMEFGTVAYDAETGEQRWSAVYAAPEEDRNLPDGIVVAPGGDRVFVTGWSASDTPPSSVLATVAYDTSTGAQVWSSLHSVPEATYHLPASMAVAPSGGTVYVTGVAKSANGGPGELAIVAYQADTGQTTWSTTYSTAQGVASAAPSSLVPMPNGDGILVAGSFGYAGVPVEDPSGSGLDNSGDYALLRYAA